MKKYQLKYNDGTELKVVKESDWLQDIMEYVNKIACLINRYSVWMNGKVLE